MPQTNIEVELIGKDGNAFYIMGAVVKVLKANGYKELAKEYQTKAMAGDYDNLLQVTMDYVVVK